MSAAAFDVRAGHLLRICNFGNALVTYGDGLRLQQQLAQLCKARAVPDTLLLLQHAPVYTLGKRGSSKDFRTAPEQLQAQGAEVHLSDRGGEVTYHGPGQVVMYPIVNLRRLGVGARAYVEGLEDAMVRVAGAYGVSARGRVPARTGVWVGDRKLGAVGVRISHGVATHGVALNVATDLRAFAPIVACGLAGAVATSLHAELACVNAAQLASAFARRFGYTQREHVTPSELRSSMLELG
ncbi:hypothetical protein WJX81_008281 [Elliptochloris bilobata]|uniref:lipoyl(octanoyl) transferase n=1 Tax=Elliptochloris bilobata TaxID=381761 RepID=A0AAW1QUM5_9CHLO